MITYGSPATFAERSCGGWFKGKEPTVANAALVANWVENAEVVYIGKADQLKRRQTQFADFGIGKPVGHWGGRLIWQLPNIGAGPRWSWSRRFPAATKRAPWRILNWPGFIGLAGS